MIVEIYYGENGLIVRWMTQSHGNKFVCLWQEFDEYAFSNPSLNFGCLLPSIFDGTTGNVAQNAIKHPVNPCTHSHPSRASSSWAPESNPVSTPYDYYSIQYC